MSRKKTILIVIGMLFIGMFVVSGTLFMISVYTHNHFVEQQPVQKELKLELSADELQLNVGDSFDAKKYIKTATDKNGKDLTNEVKIFEKIETGKPGKFVVTYRIVSQEDRIVIEKKLNVIVK